MKNEEKTKKKNIQIDFGRNTFQSHSMGIKQKKRRTYRSLLERMNKCVRESARKRANRRWGQYGWAFYISLRLWWAHADEPNHFALAIYTDPNQTMGLLASPTYVCVKLHEHFFVFFLFVCSFMDNLSISIRWTKYHFSVREWSIIIIIIGWLLPQIKKQHSCS